MPGANRATVSALQDLVSTAGGKLVGRYRVGDKLGDDANKELVDQLGTQLEPEADDVEMPDDVSTYQRFGLLLGRAIGTESQGATALRHHELAAWSRASAPPAWSPPWARRRAGPGWCWS